MSGETWGAEIPETVTLASNVWRSSVAVILGGCLTDLVPLAVTIGCTTPIPLDGDPKQVATQTTHRSSNIYGVLDLDEVASGAPPQNDARLVEKLSIILMVKYAVKQSQHDQKKIQY
ncbi:MAG: hypothetical protein DME83_05550 [Verrucomicrobia bacterium]|nr:MAG: hypothetical protein DME83_05550 [Verrucomicrobiota bacterium]